MTKLLISVTSISEAKIAIENGADMIDLKDPSLGALGALPIEIISDVVVFVKSQNRENIQTSATIGDIPMLPSLIHGHVTKLIDTRVDFIKIGFFECEDYQPILETMRQVTQLGTKLIAVLFAEFKYPAELLSSLKSAGFAGVMLDTATKNGQTLFNYYSKEQLKEFALAASKQDLLLGLAGSLKLQHVVMLKEVSPTYTGFRGGVCVDNERKKNLDAVKISAIRKTL
jgi:(5-formylfuran-3-yl)methyl phosphate synthase